MQGGLLNLAKRHRYYLSLALILALAAFMRFHRLAGLPPGLFPDEAANGLDVLNIIHHHDIQPFYARNGGREGLFFIIQALFVWLRGNTTYALRLAPALISTLAVGMTAVWATSWFGRRVGVVSAAIMAAVPWAVVIGRDGFRAGMVALMVPLTLWLYTKATRTNKGWWYVAAGVSLGTGFYTYIAWRLFPLALILGGIYAAKWRPAWWRRVRRGLVVSLAVCVIVLGPLSVYGIHHPGELVGRAGGVSFTNPSLNHGHPLTTLGDTILKTALMFNFHGDENYRQNLGGQPELNLFVGVMFILGLLVCAVRRRQPRYAAVLMVFGVMLLPEVLTAEGIPHALRSIGALPPTMVLAAIGINYLLGAWYRVFPLNAAARSIGAAAVIGLIILSAYQGYVEYFWAWASSPQTYAAYSEDTSTLANYFNNNPFHGQRYAVGVTYELMPVAYLTYSHGAYTPLDPTAVSHVPLSPDSAKQFSILEGDKSTVVPLLKKEFPGGHLSPHYSAFSGKELFVIYTVPAS
jgi:4-amino-4-deoxy-L-arabinose transferase-like glycosyltransferase